MRRHLRTSVAALAFCLVASNVFAAANTYLQISGVECFAQTTNTVWVRNNYGVRNDTTTAKTFSCPINNAADDTNRSNHTFGGTRLYFKGPQPTNCNLIGASETGSLTWSSSFTYNTTWGTMDQGASISPLNALSVYIQCSLPSGTTIRGATLQSTIADIAGGV